MDEEPTPEETVAMHLWKRMPPEIPVFIKLPGEPERAGDDDEEE